MSPASVTLASALQVRGEALSEEEIWSLLSLAAERLLEDLREGKGVFGPVESQGVEHEASQAISGCCFSGLLSVLSIRSSSQMTPTYGAALRLRPVSPDPWHTEERKALLLGRQWLQPYGPLTTPGQSEPKGQEAGAALLTLPDCPLPDDVSPVSHQELEPTY